MCQTPLDHMETALVLMPRAVEQGSKYMLH